MQFNLTMPKLSPTMEEGSVAKWHKKEGDHIEAGELLLEISTDKATIEHNALDEGWLRKILIPEGQSAQINQPIAIFTEKENDNFEIPKPEKPAEKMKTEEKIEETKPIQAQKAGPVLGEPLFEPEPPLSEYAFTEFPEDRLVASPLAKRLAEERGLDLTTARGTGPGGRITSKDLESAQPAGLVTFGSRERPTETPGSFEEIPLSPMRKIVAKRLQESKTFIPHFYVKQVIEATNLVSLRDQLKNVGQKVTFNDFVIRAAALALRQHPEINAGFNSKNHTIIRFKTIDISIAVTVEGGLITPIIRHADYKNLGEISLEMRALSEKARKGKLQENEYKGGSFCVSNLGMFGISEFTAVINPPQAAILAVGGIEDQPVVKNGHVIAGKTLALVLSVDHRVIDGAAAAQFLKSVQHLLENPAALIL